MLLPVSPSYKRQSFMEKNVRSKYLKYLKISVTVPVSVQISELYIYEGYATNLNYLDKLGYLNMKHEF